MKILFIVSLYSHMLRSVVSGVWQPAGMPGFYRLVEKLNTQGIKTDILFLSRAKSSQVRARRHVTFRELEHVSVQVLPQAVRTGSPYVEVLNDLSYLVSAWRLIRKNAYDLVYCDRASVIPGGILACLRTRVVLRMFGVGGLYDYLRQGRRLLVPFLLRLCFRAQFAYVICSQDGSPAEQFLKEHIRPSVPTAMLLNGVDEPPVPGALQIDLREHFNIPASATIIITTGRLEEDKSPLAFVRVLAELKKLNSNFFGIIVGEGSLREQLEHMTEHHGLRTHLAFAGAVPHSLIYQYLTQADIYVSLNSYGNLSNAVLEAMSAGKCIVTLKACPQSHRDAQADDPELQNALVLVDRKAITETLPAVLNNLISNPQRIRQKSQKVASYAKSELVSWDTRIATEIDILCDLVQPGSARSTKIF